MGLFSLFSKPKKMSAPEYRELPSYNPSSYDAPSAKQLYDTYSGRAAGKGVGFEPGDLGVMRGQEIDQQVRGANEIYSRSMAGRRNTGGVTTGGTNRIRDKALLSTSVAKSQALRDIAIRNAVLKREETWQGIQGLDNFLQSERSEAWRKTEYEAQRTGDYNEAQRYGQNITNQNRGIYNSWMGSNLDETEDRVYQAVMAGMGGGSNSSSSKSAKSYDYFLPQGYSNPNVDYNLLYGKPKASSSVVGMQNYRYR